MASSVIRSDVVQIGFDVDDSPLSSLISQIRRLERDIAGIDTDSGFDDLTDTVREAEDGVQDLRREADRLENTGADDLGNDLQEAGNSAEEATGKMKGGFSIVKGVIADLISNGIQMLMSSMTDLAKQTIQVGADFDSSMSEVAAISGASADELQMLRDTAKEFGSTTTFSASESAQALKYMALAGWDAEKSSSALGGVLDLAASAGMDLAQASDMVTDYMSAFGMEAEKSGYFADMLSYSQSNANTSVEQLGEAFKNCAANMNAAGQDVETTTSLLAMMANQGFKGSEAGTALTAIMRDMTAKMKDGAITIGDTAVQVQDANGNYRDLTDILKDVEKATDGMGDAERATALSTAFTADSIKGMNLLLNAGVGEAESFEEALRKSGGTAKETADIMNDNLNGDITALKSQIEGLQISIYEKLQPALRAIVGVASKILTALPQIVAKIKEFAVSSGFVDGVKAAFERVKSIVEPLIGIIIRVAQEIYNIATSEPVVAAVGFAFETVKGVLDKITAAARDVFTFIGENIEWILPLVEGLAIAFVLFNAKILAVKIAMVALKVAQVAYNVVMGITNAIMAMNPITLIVIGIGLLIGAIILCIKHWDKVKEVMQGVWDKMVEVWGSVSEWFTTNVVDPVVNFFTAMWEKIKGAFTAVVDFVKENWLLFLAFLLNPFAGLFATFYKYNDGFREKVDSVIEAIKTAVSNAIQAIISFFEPFVSAVVAIVSKIVEIYLKLWEIIFALAKAGVIWVYTNVITPVVQFFVGLWENIKAGAQALWATIVAIFTVVASWVNANIIVPIVNFVTALWTKVTSIAQSIWNTMVTIFSVAASWVNSNVVQPIVNFMSGMWTSITGIFSKIGSWFSQKFTEAYNGVKKAFSKTVSFFQDIWDNIKSMFTKIGTTIGNGIADAFKTVVNSVINFAENTINGFIRAINGAIDLINKIPGVEISKITELSIPRLAKGGIVDKPTIAQIGEDGKEAVVPLENNLGWVKKVISGVTSALKAPSTAQTSYNSSSSLYKTSNSSTEYNYYSPSFTLNMTSNGGSESERTVKRWIKESLEDVFDSLDRTHKPTVEV